MREATQSQTSLKWKGRKERVFQGRSKLLRLAEGVQPKVFCYWENARVVDWSGRNAMQPIPPTLPPSMQGSVRRLDICTAADGVEKGARLL